MIAGLAGYVQFEASESAAAWLPRMLEAMPHRGAQSHIHYPRDWIGLGIVQDASEPLRLCHNDQCCSLLDGEIHSGIDHATTDDEATCHPQLQAITTQSHTNAHQLFSCLTGDYALAIWDHTQRAITLCRDAFGARPLYLYRQGNKLAFASEIKALRSLPWIPTNVNRDRIADYFLGSLEGIDKRTTFFEHILRVPAGCSIRISRDSYTTHQHFDPSNNVQQKVSPSEAVEGFMKHFSNAIAARYQSPARTGLLLSGGLDSCSIAEIAARQTDGNLNTYSLISGQHDPHCEESKFVEIMQTDRNWNMKNLLPCEVNRCLPGISDLMSRIENPFTATLVAGPIPLFSLGRVDGLKKMITGVDGDVVTSLTGNYQRFLANEQGIRAGLREMYQEAIYYDSKTELPRMALDLIARQLTNKIISKRNPFRQMLRRRQSYRSRIKQRVDSSLRASFAKEVNLLDRFRQQLENEHPFPPSDMRTACAHTLSAPYLAAALERYEEAAAIHSLTVSHPFMDQRLVEFCLELPWNFRIHDGVPKWILRQAMKEVLPAAITNQYKVENIGQWFSDEVFGKYLRANFEPPEWLLERLEDFIMVDTLKSEWSAAVERQDQGIPDLVTTSIILAEWLRQHF